MAVAMAPLFKKLNRGSAHFLGKLPRFLGEPLIRLRQGVYIYFKHQYLASMARKQRDSLGRPLRILEIGALEGGGTSVLAKYGSVLTVDIWEDEKIRQSFLRRTRGNKNVKYIQANSLDYLPRLEDNMFDFIFIDGCHHYTETMSDIENAKRLIREGGVIVGDDLDVSVNEADRVALWGAREQDVVRDPKTGRMCHPGVTLAVAEHFGSSIKGGPYTFWAVRKTSSKFVDIGL